MSQLRSLMKLLVTTFFFFMGGPVSVLDGHVKETYEMSIALGARP